LLTILPLFEWGPCARHANTLKERMAAAIPLYRGALADCERVRGTDHPSTLRSRNNLAMAYRAAGRTAEAIPLLERTLADYERVRGADHPDTETTRSNLAMAYRAAGRTAEAIPLLERTLADRERVLGTDHPDTNAARADLAAVTGKQKRHQRVRSGLLYRLTWESKRPRRRCPGPPSRRSPSVKRSASDATAAQPLVLQAARGQLDGVPVSTLSRRLP
jgi:tetratricopeptide (TPR) repeat protein